MGTRSHVGWWAVTATAVAAACFLGLSGGFVGTPSEPIDSLPSQRVIGPACVAPFLEGLGFGSDREKLGDFSVSNLLRLRGPAAVSGLVVSKPINPVNGVAFVWADTHIRKEVLELHPPFANRNSQSTPPLEVFGCRAGTAMGHGTPAAPRWSAGHSVCFPLLGAFHSNDTLFFSVKTPTTNGASSPQTVGRNRLGCPTVAFAQPDTGSVL